MIGVEFASRLSGRPDVPMADPDDRCPVCAIPGGRCSGPGVAHVDMASRIQEFAVARGQQQTRRAPGRPLADPEAEAARQQAWLAKQDAATPSSEASVREPGELPADTPVETPMVAADPAPVAEPVAVFEPVEASKDEVAPSLIPPDPAAAAAVDAITEPAAMGGPAPAGTAMTLAPVNPELGRVVDPDAGSPRFTDGPTLVRGPEPGVYRTQGADARIGTAPIPAGEPGEVRDVYVVPDGVIAPENDPARPDPADAVLVGDAAQLVATGAWASLPGGTSIVTTRKVLRVWWPMGTLSPCYSTVADRGVVLPRPAAAR